MKIQYDAIKACHVVPSTVKNNIMPAVICNFLYFEGKTMIYKKMQSTEKQKKNNQIAKISI